MSNAKKYYTFSQTNSGGYYLFDTQEVIVEADSLQEAIEIAERETEVYPGMGSNDCECCGPRWDYPWNNDFESRLGYSSWEDVRRDGVKIIYK